MARERLDHRPPEALATRAPPAAADRRAAAMHQQGQQVGSARHTPAKTTKLSWIETMVVLEEVASVPQSTLLSPEPSV